METITTKADLAAWISSRAGRPRVLVPTMGALHRGHTSLLDLAAAEAARIGGEVVATIFVNPVQFGPHEDYGAYPRPLQADLAKCREHGAAAVFAPSAEEVYAADRSVTVTESSLSRGLCGASRPGHFDGVCTVVAKLLNLVRPEAAIFGEKDYQQLAVIRRLVRDLDFPVRVLAGPTVRESDGLALSSRNAYLTPAERAEAPLLGEALRETALEIARGELADADAARERFEASFSRASLGRLDYFDAVDAETLEPLPSFAGRRPRLIAAAFFGRTRLIDNVGLPE
jgi:pantoate--beta-alanine ligase